MPLTSFYQFEWEMIVTDQPGRVAAVCLFAPLLIGAGLWLRRSDAYRQAIGTCIALFGAVLLVYEVFWITCARPKTCRVANR